MKYLICALVFLSSCSMAPLPSTPAPRTICVHPMAMGGQPFVLPVSYTITSAGLLMFETPEGSKVTLSGAMCITMEKK